MGGIEDGSKVTMHYTLTVEGQQVDSSSGGDPLVFTQGAGEIIPGLEAEITGLKAGDKKSVDIPPEAGYGPRLPEAIQKVPRNAFGDVSGMKKGDVVTGQAGGQQIQATIVEIGNDTIILDLNHPLAGKALHFDVEVVGVE